MTLSLASRAVWWGVALAVAALLSALPAVADATVAATVELDDFTLSCPTVATEGSPFSCTLKNTSAESAPWPVAAVLHLSSDTNRMAQVAGSPLDVRLQPPVDGVTVERGVEWIEKVLVGFQRIAPTGQATASQTLTVSVEITDDDHFEEAEYFYVALGPNGTRGVGFLYDHRARVTVSANDSRSDDASLSGLAVAVAGAELALDFSADQFSYTANVAYEITEAVVTPTTSHRNASVTVAGRPVERGAGSAGVRLGTGSTAIDVQVTAEDGESTRRYRLTVARADRPTEIALREGAFSLVCPSTVDEGSRLICRLTNTTASATPFPSVAVLHNAADPNPALVSRDSATASFSRDVRLYEGFTPGANGYNYGYGELFSGGSRTVRTVYGYEKFNWAGEAGPSSAHEVRIWTRADGIAEGDEVFYVALAPAGERSLSRFVENAAPVVVTARIATAAVVAAVAVVSDPGPKMTYGNGDTIRIRVTFDQPVEVTGTPRLKIDLDPAHGGEKWADYESGSGTAALVFAFGPVAPPNLSRRGIAVLADTLEVNGGTIRSQATREDAVLEHPGLGHDPAHKVDGTQPALTAVALTSTPQIDADGDGTPETYGAGETIEVTVTWDADVVWDVSAPRAAIKLDLDIGGHTKRLSMVADRARGTARSLVFHYEVRSTDTDTDGIFPKPFGTDLVLLTRGATLKSASGIWNARRAHAALAPDPLHKVDGARSAARPALTAVALTSTPGIDADGDGVPETYGVGETIEVTVTWAAAVRWDVSAATVAAIKLDLDIGGSTKRLSMVTDGPRGTARSLVFHYEVQSEDRAPAGIFPKPWGNYMVLLTQGATLTSVAGGRPAWREHAALAPDPAHKVDGGRTAARPDPPAPVPVPRTAITAVALTSTPQIDADSDGTPETYGLGETIEVTVTWDADVVWDVSAPRAAIKLDLDIGGHTKRISMVADEPNGTARSLVFHYEVQSTDTDTDGLFPKPFGTDLVLLTRGAMLTSAAGGRNARRAHAAVAPDPLHKVDGRGAPSTPAPASRARGSAAGAGAPGERRADDAPLAFLAETTQERRVEPHRPAGFPIGPPVAASGAAPLAWTLDDPEGLFAIDSDTGQIHMAVDGATVFEVYTDKLTRGLFRRHADPVMHYQSLVFDVPVTVMDGLGRTIETAVAIRMTVDTPGEVDLSSYTPQVGTALQARLVDPDGVLSDSVRWQWEYDDGNWREDDAGGLGPDWQAVAGATGATFTPLADMAGYAVRVVVRYADGLSGPDEPAKHAVSASTDAIQ